MRVNTDYKANVTLGVLALGLICTILAISTDHWHEYKVTSKDIETLNSRQGATSISMQQYIGLWNTCFSVTVGTLLNQTKCFKVTEWKEVNSFLSHDHNAEGEDHDEREHINDFESHNRFGGDNQRRKKRDVDVSWHRAGNFFRRAGNAPETWESGRSGASGDNRMKKALYPDYQKSVQAMEILALISGVGAIGVWAVYICSSAMSDRTTHIVKIIAILLVVLTVLFHGIAILVWVGEKEKQKKNHLLTAIGSDIPGFKPNYGWSWGVAVGSTLFHLLSIIPLVLTKPNQPDDGIKQTLTPKKSDVIQREESLAEAEIGQEGDQ